MASLSLLIGCSCLKPAEPIKLPADLTAPCPDAPTFIGTSNRDLFKDDLRVTAWGESCELKHNKLSELLKSQT